MTFLLNTSLDVFHLRQNSKTSIDQDLGLLQAIDERLAMYGWLTNTGVKFVIMIDMAGRSVSEEAAETDRRGSKKGTGPILGLRDSDLKPVCCTQDRCWGIGFE